jgi:peptidoglycan/LPS O-acetylase OafA/YrhL
VSIAASLHEQSATEHVGALPPALTAGLAAKHLSGIDGLRAISALLVVLYHAGVPAIPAGTGVLAFFVLSGFLITRLIIAEERETNTVSLKRFYVRRSFRIFPAFYAYWLFWVIFATSRHHALNGPQTLSAFLYVSNYYQALFGDPNNGLSHAWSLGVEEQFYLLWPFAFLLLRNNGRRFTALVILIPLLWVYREALIHVVHVNQRYIYEAFDTRVDHILIGCLLAVALECGRFTGLWRIACASPYMTLVTLLLMVVAVRGKGYLPVHDYRDSVEFVVVPVLCAILIAQLIAFPSHAVTSLFNWTWMRFLGKISYSIYLYQQLVVYPARKLFTGSPTLGVLAAVAASIMFAIGSFYLIEQPFLRLRQRVS